MRIFRAAQLKRGAVATLLTATMLAGSLTACAAGGANTPEAKALTEVRFSLSWNANPNHAGIFAAIEKGWYKEAGIDLKILPYSGLRPTQVIAEGAADAGDTNTEAVLNASLTKTPVTMVHNTQQVPSYGVLTLESAGITQMKQLSGKKYADWGSRTIRDMVMTAIQNDGGTPAVETINLAGPDAYFALNEGRVDFTTGFDTVEGERAKLQGKPYHFLDFQDFGIPANPADIGIVLANGFIEAHPEAAAAFTKATQRGYDWAAQNPDEAAKLLIKANPAAKLDPQLTQATMRRLAQNYWQRQNGKTGYADLTAWQRWVDYMLNHHLVGGGVNESEVKTVNVQDLVTNRFLD